MPIPLQITFRGMDPSPAVEERIRNWTAKLETVYARVLRCQVVIESPHRHHRQGQQYRVRISLDVPGGDVIVARDPGVDGAHEDVHVAVRDAFAAARRRLEDHVRQLRGDVKTHEEPGREV